MKSVPEHKAEFAVYLVLPDVRAVYFNASPDVAMALAPFGDLGDLFGNNDSWSLYVDARFDFTEVVAYLQSWQPESEVKHEARLR
jgi:hypothetical protein